jgi:hypothetical protein
MPPPPPPLIIAFSYGFGKGIQISAGRSASIPPSVQVLVEKENFVHIK